jgi:LysM repeat protein
MTLEESQGYFIYYDKNESMHEYMVHNKMSDNTEKAVMLTPDSSLPLDHAPVVDSLRARSLTKAYTKEAQEQKRVVNLLVGLCAVLFIVSFIVGAGLIQNQDRISTMERQLLQLSASYRNLTMQLSRDNTEPVFAGEDEQSINNGLEDMISENGNISPQPTNTDTPTAEPLPTLPLEPLPESYTVRDGDTLNSISIRFYGTSEMVSRIMEYNGITDPNLIVTGSRIELPPD